MALRTEAVVEAVARGFDKVQRELRETGSAADKAGGQTDRAGAKGAGGLEKWQRAAVGMAAAAGTAYVAGKQLYQAIGEGAELNLARDRFDALAGSIGTTSDALLGKFTEATGGMLSNAEMVASASQIISTGLAGSEEDVVRLATVVSELGLDMGQVILTFANNSKMRLDSLGLSVADVDAKTKEFVATGMTMDAAFDAAVLELLEGRLELVGSAADTAAGDMRRFNAEAANLTDTIKQKMADSAAPWLASVNDMIAAQRELQRLEDLGAIQHWENVQTRNKGWFLGVAAIQEQVAAYGDVQRAAEGADRVLQNYQKNNMEILGTTTEYTKSLEELARQGREVAQAEQWKAEVTARATTRTNEATEAAQLYSDTLAGSMLAAVADGTAESENFNSVLFDQIAALTDDATVLAAAGVATGEWSNEQAAAAIKAGLMAEKATALAGAVEAGEMSVWEAVDALQAYQDEIDNTQGDYYIRFHIQTIGNMPTTTGPGTATGGIPIHEGTGGDDPNFASGTGGWRRVPGGMGQPFPVTLHGGEMFNVTPVGQRGGAGGGGSAPIQGVPGMITINVQTMAQAHAAAGRIAQSLAQPG